MTEWFLSIPLYWAQVLAILLFLGIIVWVWLLPREYIYSGALDKAGWRDVRIWATIICLIQIVLYLIFN